MPIPDSVFAVPLTEAQLKQRRFDRTEEQRAIHQTFGKPLYGSEFSLVFVHHCTNASRLNYGGAPSSLGTPEIDHLGWIEDFRCPFCPPYSFPLDTEIPEDLQLVCFTKAHNSER